MAYRKNGTSLDGYQRYGTTRPPRYQEGERQGVGRARRGQFDRISDALLAASPAARGELTTIYVKYVADEIGNQPYAVVWLKNSKELVVGLALPEGYESPGLGPPMPGYKYAKLTRFLRITPNEVAPPEIARWASIPTRTSGL